MENLEVNKTSVCMMAFGKAEVSKDEVEVKRYTGIAPVSILAVNPDKETLSKLYGFEVKEEPVYTGEVERDGNNVQQARIDFIVKTDAPRCNDIDAVLKVTFFLSKAVRVNKDKTKVQVIDKYGRTAWVTQDEFKTKSIPVYKNGPANLDKDYRATYIGEVELTSFIRTYLGIQDVMEYVNNTWVMKKNPEDYEGRLDDLDSYFAPKNNIKEIKDLIKLLPENKIKVLFGVRTASNGNMYQTSFNSHFAFNNSTSVAPFERELSNVIKGGGLSTTEFVVGEFQEYKVTPTNLNNEDPLAPDNSGAVKQDTSDWFK